MIWIGILSIVKSGKEDAENKNRDLVEGVEKQDKEAFEDSEDDLMDENTHETPNDGIGEKGVESQDEDLLKARANLVHDIGDGESDVGYLELKKIDFIGLQETKKGNFSQNWLESLSGIKNLLWLYSMFFIRWICPEWDLVYQNVILKGWNINMESHEWKKEV
ncbi:hypothetical protein ACJX0J_029338 [Zea mays]